MSLCVDDEKLLQKYKALWTEIEDIKLLKQALYQSVMIDT